MAAHLSLIAAGMSTWRRVLVVAALLLTLCGCTDPLAEENEALRKEIIEVHDQAMDKIGYMFVLETRLKKLTPGGELSRNRIDNSIKALQQANKEMFKWMNQYQTLFMADDISGDNGYRLQQLDKIGAVSHMINEAIADAEHILAVD